MASETAFCINCGNEIENELDHCPECGASQNPDELDVDGKSVDVGEVEEKGPSAPFGIPKEVYHNKNWKRVKLAVAAPILLAIPAFIAVGMQQPLPDDPNLLNYPIVALAMAVWIIGSNIAYIGFVIYTSRDKRVIHDKTGHSTKRTPVLIGIFFIFTVGLYMFYYLIMRNHRYEIDDGESESTGAVVTSA